MSDPQPPAPAPTPAPAAIPVPSFSIEVPVPGEPAAGQTQPSTYFRVGGVDATSAREMKYYSDKKDAKPGILMISPSQLVQVADSTVSMTTSAQKLAVVAAGTQVISATYSFAETGTFRDVSYKLSHATSFSIGDSQTWKLAANSDIGVSNDQKVSVAGGVAVKMASDVGISLGLLSVAADWDSIDVKAVGGKSMKTVVSDALAGGIDLTLTVNPTALMLAAMVKLVNKIMQGLSGILVGLAGIGMTAAGAVVMDTGVDSTTGAVLDSNADQVRSRLTALGGSGFAALAVLSVIQASYLILGVVAIKKKLLIGKGVFPSIVIDTTSITLLAGLSKIVLDPTGIKMEAGPTSTSNLLLTGASVTAPTFGVTAGAATFNMNPAAATIAAPTVAMTGTLNASVSATAVMVSGTATVAIRSPLTNFTP